MNHLRKIIILLALVTVIPVCAQDADDGWLKRKWGDMIARYNVYFNATQKLDEATRNLAKGQKDDFEEILEAYAYGAEDDLKGMREPMETVMKKASKVIQNRPRSKWADDAYFVIGQSHFFKGDYYSAIEVFQFVNTAYKDEDLKAMAQLWLMKSYMKQERYNDAEAVFSLLKKNKSKASAFITHRNITGGDLLVKQGKKAEAIEFYSKGLSKLKDRTLAYRTNFILGQLYQEQENYDLATKHFERVQRLNAPYDYVFQSNLGMVKASSQAGGAGAGKTKKYLKRMLSDDKNVDYFDQIYYELANLEFSSGNEDLGLSYMQQSAANSGSNMGQQTKTYLYLADYYFGDRQYGKAQAYYDSAVAIIPKDYPDAEKINAKHGVLSKLIDNIETIRTQDSLLTLAKLDRSALDRKIDNIIQSEEKRKKEEAEALKIQQEQERLNPTRGGPVGQPASGGVWYFYNQSSVARGNNDFKRTWGNRQNTDWWRFVNKSVTETAVPKTSNPDAPDADPDTYVSNLDKEQQDALSGVDANKIDFYKDIPFSETAKLVAEQKIEDAFMSNGRIYFDELKEYTKSISNINTLLGRFASTTYKPEALFYLARAERELGNTSAYDKYAAQIQSEYPNTTYNQVLNATEVVEDTKDKEAIAMYSTMYDAFEGGNYPKAIGIKKQIETNYPGNSIQAKIDYLYALIIGKTEGKDAYIKQLQLLVEDYTGNEVGEMAAYTLTTLQTNGMENQAPPISKKYKADKKGKHYYMITGKTKNEKQIKVALDEYNRKYFSSQKLVISSLLLGQRQTFYVRQFDNAEQAMAYHKDFKDDQAKLANSGLADIKFYAISEANFKALIKDQKEDDYITFFNTTY